MVGALRAHERRWANANVNPFTTIYAPTLRNKTSWDSSWKKKLAALPPAFRERHTGVFVEDRGLHGKRPLLGIEGVLLHGKTRWVCCVTCGTRAGRVSVLLTQILGRETTRAKAEART